jgi:2-oxoglutarate dehydrogenase E1 component
MSSLPITSVFNDGYIAEVYESYRRDPASVDESWRQFFRVAESIGSGGASGATQGGYDASLLRKAAAASSLLGAIQRYGHLAVALDPLGSAPPGAAELTPAFHGITDADLQRLPSDALGYDGLGTGADVVQKMRDWYSSGIAYEFEHLGEEGERQWFRQTIESGEATAPLSADEMRALLQRLTEVDGLERFLGLAYVSVKRFSIEGVDALVPMLDAAISYGAKAGTRSAIIGMAHRGRLNVLTHVMGKPYSALFEEFEGRHPDTNAESDTGDVKYHMGYRGTYEVAGAAPVAVELIPNPSHLEVVNPVVAGVARARQRVAGGATDKRDEMSVLPILVHGDASFPGEGVVPETLNMSLLRGYRVGGTLHIIANNQVGFTTDPIDARSTHYASDLAKGFEIPVVHINADDAEACIQAVRLAIAYRQHFNKDFLIDLVGYRRHGHNEADQPAFTQPMMYKIIADHPTARQVLGARLVRERVMTEDEVNAADSALSVRLNALYQEMKKAGHADTRGDAKDVSAPIPAVADTAVRAEKLVALNEQLLSWPSTFKLHPTMQRTLPRRRDAINTGAIDWGHAESLAFASLLTEGTSVRITGQDAERGTFSHRQAVLHDVNTGETFTPLANLPQSSGAFEIYNSPLSETAVLGFEYGLPMLRSPSWTSSSPPVVPSGSRSPAWSCCCRTAMRGRGRSTRARVSNAICNCRPRRTWSWPIPRRPRSTSTCCAGRPCAVRGGHLCSCSPSSCCVWPKRRRSWRTCPSAHSSPCSMIPPRRTLAMPCSASCSAPARSTTIWSPANTPRTLLSFALRSWPPGRAKWASWSTSIRTSKK